MEKQFVIYGMKEGALQAQGAAGGDTYVMPLQIKMEGFAECGTTPDIHAQRHVFEVAQVVSWRHQREHYLASRDIQRTLA